MHAELLRASVDREDVVDGDAEVVALRRLVVLREDVQLRVAEAEPVDPEAEVRRRDPLDAEEVEVEAPRGVLIGRGHADVVDPKTRHRPDARAFRGENAPAGGSRSGGRNGERAGL